MRRVSTAGCRTVVAHCNRCKCNYLRTQVSSSPFILQEAGCSPVVSKDAAPAASDRGHGSRCAGFARALTMMHDGGHRRAGATSDRALTGRRTAPTSSPNGWSTPSCPVTPSISPSTCPISSTASARRWWRASRPMALAGARLSIASWRVLAALSSNGGLRQTDLAELTSIDASTLSRLITRLVRDGLVRRTRSKSDSREVAVGAHPQGRDRACESSIPIATGLQRHATRSLSKRRSGHAQARAAQDARQPDAPAQGRVSRAKSALERRPRVDARSAAAERRFREFAAARNAPSPRRSPAFRPCRAALSPARGARSAVRTSPAPVAHFPQPRSRIPLVLNML